MAQLKQLKTTLLALQLKQPSLCEAATQTVELEYLLSLFSATDILIKPKHGRLFKGQTRCALARWQAV